MEIVQDQVESYRRELDRVLGSHEFAGSRQQRDFLLYVCDAAFQRRARLDQVEIAREVLRRGDDFNPVYDPAVRKLATLTRQRLESYYAKEGLTDPVVISLPARTYIPQFHVRDEQHPTVEPITRSPEAVAAGTEEARPPEVPRNRIFGAAGVVAVILAVAAVIVVMLVRSREEKTGEFVLQSVRGDIMHETNELNPTAIQLGPKIGLIDQVTVRMKFVPDRATQQAGLMIYENADRYVKLGRQFLSRTQLEFGMETGARYQKPPNTFSYDHRGQTGEPIWLSIRRIRDAYTAYISYDGYSWRPFGNTLVMPDPMPTARIAIFANNGRSDAPAAEARFDRLTAGLDFFDWPNSVSLAELPGWHMAETACAAPAFDNEPGVLLPFNSGPQNCHTDLARPIPSGDWSISTELEFAGSGTAAGLMCQGTKGRFRLIQWDLNGGSISAEHLGHNQVSRPNFSGNPPIVLRMQNRGGYLQGSFSRDGTYFEEIALKVPLEELGKDVKIGLHTAKSTGAPRLRRQFRAFDIFTKTFTR